MDAKIAHLCVSVHVLKLETRAIKTKSRNSTNGTMSMEHLAMMSIYFLLNMYCINVYHLISINPIWKYLEKSRNTVYQKFHCMCKKEHPMI